MIRRILAGLAAALAATGVAVLAIPTPAAAHNCGSLTDCLPSGRSLLLALAAVLVVAGLVILFSAGAPFLFGGGALALAGGGVVSSAGAISLSTVVAGTATLGTGIALASAAEGMPTGGGSGGSGGGGRPDIPRQPPAPRPQVRHWRLRRIVDDLWKGTRNPNRVGNGTTMDAVRNELLTGRPTNGVLHSDKARQAVNALDRWIRQYGSQATRADRLEAYRLRAELLRALGG